MISTIFDRFERLGLPKEQTVIIGSGLLDALGLRIAGDLDIVASPELFKKLLNSKAWHSEERHGEIRLTNADAELWQSWDSGGTPNFNELYQDGLRLGGLIFANPARTIAWKETRDLPKDRRDVVLLKEYFHL